MSTSMTDQSPEPRRGRRSMQARRTAVNATTLLALLLPVLSIGALLLVTPAESNDATYAPDQTDLSTASVICPSGLPGSSAAYLGTAQPDAAGDVQVGLGKESVATAIASNRLTAVSEAGPLAVRGEDELAPGLVAARYAQTPLAAVECQPVSPDQWFTGVGAGAGHSSVLELVNPDAGPAVADVTVYGRGGVVAAPKLRGIAVAGGESLRLDLASVIPRRDELAIRVSVVRGRIGSSVLDTYDELGAGDRGTDWLPAQAAPAISNVLLGLPPGAGRRTLVLANAGVDEVRATVRIVTADSVFAPSGVAEIPIAPASVTRVSLTSVLRTAIRDGALGIVVDATAPVTATVRSFVDGDLSHAVAGTPVSTSTTAIVPGGQHRLVLAGADAVGVVTVVSRSLLGDVLATQRVELMPGRGATIALPQKAALLTITPERTSVIGAVLVTGDGAAVVRLHELVRSGLIPDVRPGLP